MPQSGACSTWNTKGGGRLKCSTWNIRGYSKEATGTVLPIPQFVQKE